MDFQFNSQQFAPQYGSSGGLPDGRHKVIISASAPEPVKDKPQNMKLVLTLKCVEGAAINMTQTDNLNMVNDNADAVEIGNKKLSAYCHVTGVFAFTKTEQLHNIPFWVDIGPQNKNPQYSEIKAIYDINGNPPGKSGQAAAAPAPVQAAPPPPPPAEAAPAGFGGPAPAAGAWPAETAAQTVQGFGAPAAAPAGFGAPAAAPAGFGAPAAAPGGFGAPAGGAAPWGPR